MARISNPLSGISLRTSKILKRSVDGRNHAPQNVHGIQARSQPVDNLFALLSLFGVFGTCDGDCIMPSPSPVDIIWSSRSRPSELRMLFSLSFNRSKPVKGSRSVAALGKSSFFRLSSSFEPFLFSGFSALIAHNILAYLQTIAQRKLFRNGFPDRASHHSRGNDTASR